MESLQRKQNPYPFNPKNFQENVNYLSQFCYNGKRPEELTYGFALDAHMGQGVRKQLFIGSQEGSYNSAMFLDWWSNTLKPFICSKREIILSDFFAEHWHDEPGTDKHSFLDFIRETFRSSGHIALHPIEDIINDLWEQRKELPREKSKIYHDAVNWTIDMLGQGKLRVAEKIGKNWITHTWVLQAIDLYRDVHDAEDVLKDWINPPGVFISDAIIKSDCLLEIGAHIDERTRIGRKVIVCSGVQIGKNVRISRESIIGLRSSEKNEKISLTVIEDDCVLREDARIGEGVIVRQGSVITEHVHIDAKTEIYHSLTGKITYGEIPPNSVVVPSQTRISSSDQNRVIILRERYSRIKPQTRSIASAEQSYN